MTLTTHKIWIIAVCVLAIISGKPASGAEMKLLARLHVQGNYLAKPDGTPVTLRGVSLCSLEWHKPLDLIEDVTNSPKKWDVTVLRLPVQVKEWEKAGPQRYLKDRLDPAVALCKKNGVYCIIDWHEIGAWDDPEVVRKLENFWKIVAPRYARNPNILYEVFNEPTTPVQRNRENWLAWRKVAQKWVDTIRKYAPDTVILVGSPHWSQMPGFAAQDPFRGKNLAYVMHIYPNWKRQHWDTLFGDAADKIPLFITEWGWTARPENKKLIYAGNLQDYGQPLKDYLESKPTISWTAWSYDPLCGPAMLGRDKDMGNFVKSWLSDSK